ncbi:uncharacterized protein LOC135225433 [Macrobrachium nipponense]|uniref:uncharacterized protein LOC135225433 n=1 Tax=Macrobrachium nipponense TaxID=159736 RepID=UPI0030C7E12F
MEVARPTLLLLLLFIVLWMKSVSVNGQTTDVNLTDIKITFVDGIYEGNDFIVAEGLSIPAGEAFLSYPTDLLCDCRMECFRNKSCSGSSLQVVDGASVCRLTTKHARQNNFQRQQGATYIFKAETPPNIFYGLGTDNLFYHVPSKDMNYKSSTNSCQKIPGHRFAKYNTASKNQREAMTNVQRYVGNKDMWIDNGALFWYLKGGEIATGDGVMSMFYLCQANPLNIDW